MSAVEAVRSREVHERGAGDRWSVFFDTTELAGKRIPSARLKETAKKRGAGLYVCQLVIDERAFQLLQEFHAGYETSEATRDRFGRYVNIEVGHRKDDQEMLALLKAEVQTELENTGFIVIPTLPVTPEDIAAIASQRSAASEGDKEPGITSSLNDAAILLSSLKFAQANGLGKCIFVSHDRGGFSDRIVRALGARHGGDWVFLTLTDDAIQFLEAPDLAKAATEFMRAKSDSLLRFIEQAKAKLWPDGFLLLVSGVRDIEAFTVVPPEDGAEGELHFRGTVGFAQRVTAAEPSPIRAAAMLYSFQPSVFGESSQQVRPIEGEAQARYEKGRFVGEPRILTVRPRGLEIR